MLTFNYNTYRIVVSNATANYADIKHSCDHIYFDPLGYEPTSVQFIGLYEDDLLLKSLLLGSSGGATVVYEHTAILDGDKIITCCADTVFCISVTSLELLWMTKADEATCFAVYPYNGDYIIHGELAISRLSGDGKIIWENCGTDIFVTPNGEPDFILLKDKIVAYDFELSRYEFDYEGNEISYTKANEKPLR